MSSSRAAALAVMTNAKFPLLATVDGNQPCLRPISPLKTDGFTVWFANLRRYGKTAQIASNDKVELCYMDGNHDQVRITGIATEITDAAERESLWNSNALLRKYLGSLDNPQLMFYQITPNRVRYMKEWALDYEEVDPLP